MLPRFKTISGPLADDVEPGEVEVGIAALLEEASAAEEGLGAWATTGGGPPWTKVSWSCWRACSAPVTSPDRKAVPIAWKSFSRWEAANVSPLAKGPVCPKVWSA